MTIKNTTTYGSQLTSLGDGSDASFWRQNTAWTSGSVKLTTPNTLCSNGSWTALTSVLSSPNGYGVTGGFYNYLIFWSFGSGSTAPSAGLYLDAGISTTNTGTGASMNVYNSEVGYSSTSDRNNYSGVIPYNAGGIQPFNLNLYVYANGGNWYASYASLVVIGIN